MTTNTPLLSRRMALGAAAAAALLTTVPTMAMGRLTDVRVVDRDRDMVMPMYQYRGELWVAGEPGARYGIELRNDSRERLLNVVSVDGVNVVTGQTASFDQAGYVLDPYQRYEVNGWRKSQRDIAAFEFTRLSNSYAARTGRPDDVGVIGVAVFREREAFTPPRPPRPPFPPFDRSSPQSGTKSSPQLQEKSARGGEPGAPLGTGHGDIERDRVGETDFLRRSGRPDEIIRIRYDSRENLIAMGVIPPDRPRWRDRRPSAFPGANRGYVPDPDR
ncbi:hypothetical protein [Hydrogenophaga sp. RWCD_12]|uniref:hypothetical protein n=1 Tax=Hydrogenophaga sp. RWCD_12 TaxID=3391190 RepID=UPI003984CC03